MDDAELERLLLDLESDRVERKESARDKERLCQAVCAFANDLPGHGQPGVLFIGVRDDGSCAGLAITDELLRELAGLRTDHQILPIPSIRVEKRTLRGCDVAVVLVEPAHAPPVRYKGLVWVRIGPRRGIATPDEERRLNERRRARDLPFDLSPISSASLRDLDLDLFRKVYLPNAVDSDIHKQNQRHEVEQLVSFRFMSSLDSPSPTVVGLLVLGRDPLRYIPGAYVQFVRFDGAGLTDLIKDREEIAGPLPELVRQLEAKLKAHISVETDPSVVPERRSADYPLEALRQLSLNAILHRNYESSHAPVHIYWFADRVEIHSPGGPFGQVTRSNFGTPGITDYRNPHLAEAMRNLGYIQKFGIGIPLARKALADNGNPPPEFHVEDTAICAVIRKRP